MKKIILFCSMIMCCFSVFSQQLTPTATTVNSGDDVTFKGNGETQFGGYFYILTSVAVTPPGSPVTVAADGAVSYFNISSLSPTTFKYKFTNSSTSAQTVFITFGFTVNRDGVNGNGSQIYDYKITSTITVNGKVTTPPVFYNAAKSQTFYNTTCAAGYSSDPYIYRVAAQKYSSTVSQADADNKAQADINANGQNVTNANTTCKLVYYNDAQSGTFTRNNCGQGSTGSSVTYTVAAHAYSSTISLADANQKAIADVNTNGQNYANVNGTCTIPNPSLSGNFQICDSPNGAATTVSVINVPAGVSVVWTVTGRLKIIGSNTNNSLTVQVDPDSTSPAPFKVVATLSNGTVLGRLLAVSCN